MSLWYTHLYGVVPYVFFWIWWESGRWLVGPQGLADGQDEVGGISSDVGMWTRFIVRALQHNHPGLYLRLHAGNSRTRTGDVLLILSHLGRLQGLMRNTSAIQYIPKRTPISTSTIGCIVV